MVEFGEIKNLLGLRTQGANYCDIIRVSHGFDGCQMLEYIADSTTGDRGAGNDDITKIFMGIDISNFVGDSTGFKTDSITPISCVSL